MKHRTWSYNIRSWWAERSRFEQFMAKATVILLGVALLLSVMSGCAEIQARKIKAARASIDAETLGLRDANWLLCEKAGRRAIVTVYPTPEQQAAVNALCGEMILPPTMTRCEEAMRACEE
jgi:hypothetical protein